jgi:hypothetical protein
MADSAKTHLITYHVADLDAGADIADIPMFRAPKDITLVEIGVIGEANPAGIDDDNTSVWLVEVGTTAIVTKTYDADNAFPNKGIYGSLGALSNADLDEGDVLTLSITNGATANTPAVTVQIEYVINEVV